MYSNFTRSVKTVVSDRKRGSQQVAVSFSSKLELGTMISMHNSEESLETSNSEQYFVHTTVTFCYQARTLFIYIFFL